MSTIKLWLALATFATIVGFSNTARGDKPRAMVVVTAATVIDEVALSQLGENLGRTDWS